jgi:hypothetical protein
MNKAKQPKETVRRAHPDLMNMETSVTNRMVVIIQNGINYKSVLDIKRDVLNVMDDDTTYVSPKKKAEYKRNLEKKTTVNQVLFYISNIFLSGCNLGIY